MDSKCHNTKCKKHQLDKDSNCKKWYAPKDICKEFIKLSDKKTDKK